VVDLIHLAAAHVVPLADGVPLADVYDPSKGGGTEPPGGDKLKIILRWLFYGVTLVCVGGVLVCAMQLVAARRRGEGDEAMNGLLKVMGACVLAGSGSAIVGALI
jgi:hypothetical protein